MRGHIIRNADKVTDLDTVEFPCEPWPMGERGSILPISGTWTLLPFALQVQHKVKGIVSCPRCAVAGFLRHNLPVQLDRGDAAAELRYQCTGCQFVCKAVFKDWDRRKLYCCAYESATPSGIKANKEYLHAESEEEARNFFWAGKKAGEVSNLVGVAPVVGYIPVDKDERKLVV